MCDHDFREIGTTSEHQGMGWPAIEKSINWCPACGALRVDWIDDRVHLGQIQLPTNITTSILIPIDLKDS